MTLSPSQVISERSLPLRGCRCGLSESATARRETGRVREPDRYGSLGRRPPDAGGRLNCRRSVHTITKLFGDSARNRVGPGPASASLTPKSMPPIKYPTAPSRTRPRHCSTASTLDGHLPPPPPAITIYIATLVRFRSSTIRARHYAIPPHNTNNHHFASYTLC